MPISGNNDFHKFIIETGTAVSNAGSDKTLNPNAVFDSLLIIPRAGWDSADIGFEVQFGNDATWYPVVQDGVPVRCQAVVADNVTISPDSFSAVLMAGIKKIRIVSINNADPYAPVNQTAERTVAVYFTRKRR